MDFQIDDKQTEFERLKKLVVEIFQVQEDSLLSTTSYVEDLGADSLELFQFITRLEEDFAIEFPSDQVEKMITLGDTFSYLQNMK